MNLKVGGSNPILGNTSTMNVFFITLCSCMVYCNTFYYQEMARIYPPYQKPRNAKVSTFWRFPLNAKNSWRKPCLLPASKKFEILGTTLYIPNLRTLLLIGLSLPFAQHEIVPVLSMTISHCGSLLGIRYLGWYIIGYKVRTGKLDGKTETFETLEVLLVSAWAKEVH